MSHLKENAKYSSMAAWMKNMNVNYSCSETGINDSAKKNAKSVEQSSASIVGNVGF